MATLSSAAPPMLAQTTPSRSSIPANRQYCHGSRTGRPASNSVAAPAAGSQCGSSHGADGSAMARANGTATAASAPSMATLRAIRTGGRAFMAARIAQGLPLAQLGATRVLTIAILSNLRNNRDAWETHSAALGAGVCRHGRLHSAAEGNVRYVIEQPLVASVGPQDR